jgi:hypothetical protein
MTGRPDDVPSDGWVTTRTATPTLRTRRHRSVCRGPAPAKRTILRRLVFLAVMLVSLYVVWPSLAKVFSSSPQLLTLNPAGSR